MANVNNYQRMYDSLIVLSNSAHKRANDPNWIKAGLAFDWLIRSETYDHCANILVGTCLAEGLIIESKASGRQQEIALMEHEERNAHYSNIKMAFDEC